MPDTTTLNGVIAILRDIRMEVKTATRDLEYDDQIIESFEYIDAMSKVAIEKLGDE